MNRIYYGRTQGCCWVRSREKETKRKKDTKSDKCYK